jgi:hypothetical protein
MAVGEDGGAQDEDEREQPDCGSDGAVAPGELEVERNIVDRDEAGCVDGRGTAEKEDSVPVAHELDGKDAPRRTCKDGVSLLDAEENEKDERHDEESDDLPAVPGVQGTAEVRSHDQCRDSPHAQDSADHVEFAHQRQGLGPLTRLEGRNPKEVHRREESGNAEVDVKRPSPRGRRLDKGTADNRSQNGTNAPDQTDEAQVPRPLAVRRVDREQRHDTKVHAVPAHAGKHAANDEGVHVGCCATEGRADVEEER